MMVIAANVAFAIAAIFLGQLFVLRRRAAPAVAVLRFAPNFDAASGGALRTAKASASSSMTADLSSTATTRTFESEDKTVHAGSADFDQVDEPRPEPKNIGATEAQPHLWPWERKARAIIDPAGHLSPVPDPVRPATDELESDQIAAANTAPPTIPAVDVEPHAAPVTEPIVAAVATHELVESEDAAHEEHTAHDAQVANDAADADEADNHLTPPAALPVDHVDADRYEEEAEAALVATSPVVAPLPWWRRFIPRGKAKVDTDPLAVNGMRLADEDTSSAVLVPRDDKQSALEPVIAAAAAAVAADDDDAPVLSDSLGLTPERRAEIAAQYLLSAAAIDGAPIVSTSEPTPVVAEEAAVEPVASTSTNASLESVPPPEPSVSAADAARALAEAQMRASAWACEAANSSQPFSVEKRRRLLEYYAATINDPASRDIVARVEREDPDLALRAAEILRQAAA
jgi:hypothetical protein